MCEQDRQSPSHVSVMLNYISGATEMNFNITDTRLRLRQISHYYARPLCCTLSARQMTLLVGGISSWDGLSTFDASSCKLLLKTSALCVRHQPHGGDTNEGNRTSSSGITSMLESDSELTRCVLGIRGQNVCCPHPRHHWRQCLQALTRAFA